MSAETVLRNVYSYLEVLEAAYSDAVSRWDVTALQHAFKWAAYCTQIFTQSEGKAYASDLDKQIQRLNRRPWALGGKWIKLSLLEHSEELLTKALLQNEHLSSQLYDEVVSSCMARGQHHIIQMCYKMSQVKSAVQIVNIFKNSFALNSGSGDVIAEDHNGATACVLQELPEECMRAQWIVLHRFIASNLKSAGQGQRVENVLQDKLKTISEHENGMEIVLNSMLVYGDGTEQQGAVLESDRFVESTTANHFILDYVLHLAKSDERIWDVPKSLLCKVAGSSFLFFTAYLRHLVEAANTMMPFTKAPPGGLTWGCPSGGMLYDTLVDHFLHLQSSEPHLADAVDASLQRLVETGYSLIWKSVMRDTNHTLT